MKDPEIIKTAIFGFILGTISGDIIQKYPEINDDVEKIVADIQKVAEKLKENL